MLRDEYLPSICGPGLQQQQHIGNYCGQLKLSTVSSQVADGRGSGIPSEGLLWDTFKECKHGQTPLETGITILRNETRIKIREYANGTQNILS